jgi:heptosyltransferase-3
MPSASGEEALEVDDFLEAKGISKGEYIVLHISAGNRFREWGEGHIIELLNLLFQKKGVRVVLVGGAEDRETARIIQERERRADSLVGRINLRQLHRLISKARLFIGPDSGPMHVAACTTTPIVAFFGPTLPENFSPWDAEFTIVQKGFLCRPCSQRECVHKDFRCIQSISAGDVYRASLKYLEGG